MAKNKNLFPVVPNSVYVWRGYMAPPPHTYADFAKFLGQIFVPACVLLQPPVGLRAYLPTMVPQENKPAAVPDQTALMFWATPQSHDLANGAIAVRIYQNLHGDVYDMVRSHTPEIPLLLPTDETSFTAEQPYFLFEESADWMQGKVRHVVGARPANVTSAQFFSNVYKWAEDFQNKKPAGIDGALVCCGNDYAVAWVHAGGSVKSFSKILDSFKSLLKVQLQVTPRKTKLPAGLWNKWVGLDLTLPENISLNIQFKRKPETNPS
jgi:hypothetical protein